MALGQQSFLLPVPTGSLLIPETAPAATSDRDFQTNRGQKSYSVRFSLIIPTYNEGKNIRAIVSILTNLLDPVLPEDYELIVVDDDSPDRTWEIAQRLMVEYPQLRVMRRTTEKGLSTAVVRGWQAANGEVLGVIDGDLQHPPQVLLKLLAAMNDGADLAVASRHIEGGGVSSWSAVRRFLSRGAQLLGLVILPQVVGRVSDPMSGYFMVQRQAIAGAALSPVGYKILIEVLGRGDIKEIAEVGYVFQERREGESKVTWKQYVDYIKHLIGLRVSRGRIGRIRQKINFPIGRFIRFGAVGFSGVFVDMAVLYLLHDQSGLGWGLTRSKAIAAEAAIINNFFWNDAWTFSDMSRQQRGWRKRIKRLLKFNIVCLMGLVLNILLLNVLYNTLHVHYQVANLLAIAIVTFWNFWINLKLSWRVTESDN
ncbi:glycosyltransferase [Chroococcidiopsidales cyanobacterium LEGE 13417]|nr:glycosyltransferase [Chroococcidiopsidales cyanobacterium LEGE 13417]